ncbi:MarR family winged helix-turn-helix transcriptional regulator [Bdellovibrio sp. HCB337]|uniref:MarR family winged helix-turn-helix transcriptional regulator n=1 Tax=Bdellovibrio sp. HCB337 TaxID=3394358 RepID=UPI0039A6AC8E
MSRRTPAGDAFSLVAVKIMYLNGILMEAGDNMASTADQSSARWRVLAAAEMKLMTVAEVARALGLARQSVQRIADSLSEEGLISYKDNPTDKRAMHVALTAAGRKALSAIQAKQRKWADEIGDKMGVRSLKEIDVLLRELIQALKES